MAGYAGFQWPMLTGVGISAIVAIFVFSRRQLIRQTLVDNEADRDKS